MTTVAYKQSCTVGSGMVYSPRIYPLSSTTNQSPSNISSVNNAELYAPMNTQGDFTTNRAIYKNASVRQAINMYIAPQSGSSHTAHKKINTIGKQTLKIPHLYSYKGYFKPTMKYNPHVSKRW